MPESRKSAKAGRKPVAIILSIAIAALGLSIAPLAVSTASASTATTLRADVLKDLNKWRVAQGAKAIKLTSRLNGVVQAEVESYGSLFEGSLPPLSYYVAEADAPTGGINQFESEGLGTPGSTSAQALEIAQSIEIDDGATTDFLTDNYAGIGVAKFEGRWDVFIDAAQYTKFFSSSSKPHVTITGKAIVGSTLTAHSTIKESASTEVDYTWLVEGEPVGDDDTYTPCDCDLGLKVSVVVTVSQSGKDSNSGWATTSSAVILPSVMPAPAVVTGDRYVGHDLTATTGTWAPEDVLLSYQWLRDDFPIPGATDDTYTQMPSDVGHKITVRIWGDADSGEYLSSSVKSTTTVKTGGPTLTNTTPPSISGTDTVGQTLTADPGVWTEGTPTFTYQWLVNGTAVSGATAKTFKIPTSAYSAAGKTVTVAVTAHETGYSATKVTSDPTPTIAGLTFGATGALGFTGTASVGSTIKALLPAYAPKPTSIAYSWSIGGTVVSTKSSYTIKPADSGATITLQVTAAKGGYVADVETDASITVP